MQTACNAEPPAAQPSLGPIEQVVDAKARFVWPGVDGPDGARYIRSINLFCDGEAIGCWQFGLSSRQTADVFLFCRDGDAGCPFDVHGRAQWQKMVGDPVFARIPGEVGYSPYWLVWTVRVPAGYVANDLKGVDGIHAAVAAGRVRADQLVFAHPDPFGPGPAVMHCALVLAGTRLEGADSPLLGKPGVHKLAIDDRLGWHKQYRVHFYDFTASEGVGPAAPTSQSRPQMIVSDLFVLFRDCAAGSTSPACLAQGPMRGAVDERDAGQDWNKDGSLADTNHVLMALPGRPPADPKDALRVYSPLWQVSAVRVPREADAAVPLIDTLSGTQTTAVRSVADLRSLAVKGLLAEPELLPEAQAGLAIPGNDGLSYFSCPVQVAKPIGE